MAVNTHFDHIGQTARVESAKLIMQKIQEIVGEQPAGVTGDFNITEDNPAYATMVGSEFKMLDAYKVTPEHEGVTYTFHDYSRIPADKAPKIDFIFITPNIKVLRTGVEPNDSLAPLSDHNPHWADLEF